MFQSHQSNWSVLNQIYNHLNNDKETDLFAIKNALLHFIQSKTHIQTELEYLAVEARKGNKEAAKQLISKMAEMNDGP